MSALENAIRDAVASGNLNYLSLAPVFKPGGKAPHKWHAVVTHAGKFGTTSADNTDPVRAIEDAIAGLNKRGPRAPKPKEESSDVENEFG
jgi:hypothetical protein